MTVYGRDIHLTTVLLMIGLAACRSTGVVPTGSGEYMVSRTDIGDTWSDGSLAKLYVEANKFCAQKQMDLERISEENKGRVGPMSANATTLRFRCIPRPK